MGLCCCCNLLYFLIISMILTVISVYLVFILIKKIIQSKKLKRQKEDTDLHIGILHPYCNAGGGGERVLWCAVKALQKKYNNIKITIYTGDVDVTPEKILQKAHNIFNVDINRDSVSFLFLKKRKWVEAKYYPYFTLLGQSIGSIVLGMEALWQHQPDIYIDTMGYSFILPVFRFIGQSKVGCYIHYPTISTDMLRRVKSKQYSYNNSHYIAKNPFLTWIKLAYYGIFAKLYSLVGRSSHTVMVNSTWTENHILALWDTPFKTHRVYPPCDVNDLKNLQHTNNSEEKIIIMSIGQFRPEKDHPLQLQAMYELRTLLHADESLWNRIKLIIIGSCRDAEDHVRLKNMQDLSKHLSLENAVEFKVNVSYQELLQCYQNASIGIHTMFNEHFGIGIVECMAAGLIMIANRIRFHNGHALVHAHHPPRLSRST